MELKDIEERIEAIYGTKNKAANNLVMYIIQSFAAHQWNAAITAVYARWINNECLLTETDFANLKNPHQMTQHLKQIEREAEGRWPNPAYRHAFTQGANFALEMDRWVKVEDGLPERKTDSIPSHDFSIDVLIADNEICTMGYWDYGTNSWCTYDRFDMRGAKYWQPIKLPQ